MGNAIRKFGFCFAGDTSSHHHEETVSLPGPVDEGLGHSFCYIGSDPARNADSECSASHASVAFCSISGAAISANTATPLSTVGPFISASFEKASAFESSCSFSSMPLQPIPKHSVRLGPILRNSGLGAKSGPISRKSGLSWGPIERGFMSGPIERGFISGPLESRIDIRMHKYKPESKKWSVVKNLKKTIPNSFWDFSKELNINMNDEHYNGMASGTITTSSTFTTSNRFSGQLSMSVDENNDVGNESFSSQSLQWAQGRAGEDRVHIVISEEHGWVFVGIYDGFNGPDATDFLLNNLYFNVYKELKGLLWYEKTELCGDTITSKSLSLDSRERVELNRKLKDRLSNTGTDRISGYPVNHLGVLKALSEALRKTEASYLEISDMMLTENPELALMGSCVLVMVMKGNDVYMMNVGDSRAVLAQKKPENDCQIGKSERDIEESLYGYEYENFNSLSSCQLTVDHNTSVKEEVRRIRNEHPDDASAVINSRVKGSLRITRAFGAGFLKQRKLNDALLGMFKINYVGNSPYISCSPSLYHHRLDPNKDKFLILSSDGLYQYLTNEEVVSEVEMFMSTFPEGDPAQHLIEEILFRAAKKAGWSMDYEHKKAAYVALKGLNFHELLDIPQGERRRYHDDISVIIISFEGRIWHS